MSWNWSASKMRSRPTATQWILVYGAWLLYIALLFGGFLLMRTAIRGWFVSLQISRWSWWAVDQFFVYVAAAFWIAAVYFLEGYLRSGAQRGRLNQRIRKSARAIGAVLLVVFLAFAGHQIYVRLFPT